MRSFPLLAAALIAGVTMTAAPAPTTNPLLAPWTGPFGAPPFAQIKVEHFKPAFEAAMAEHAKEIQAIAAAKSAPTFANTVAALDDSGLALTRVYNVFSNLVLAETNDALLALNADFAPRLAAHQDNILLNEALFRRVKAVYDQRAKLKLTPEEQTLLGRTYRRFVRGGAELDAKGKERLRAMNAELSSLGVKFEENVLKETQAYKLVIERKEDLKGLPEGVVAGAAEAAQQAGLSGKWVFTLKFPSIWPFLENADNRDLRRQILEAYARRGNQGNAFDNKVIMSKITALRTEKAHLLGYDTWAAFQMAENMAKDPTGAFGLLEKLWKPSLEKAKAERADLQAMMEKDLPGQKLEPWDWRYYETKVRKAKFDLDEEALRPYFPLNQVRDGAFAVATRLYGVTFAERKDIPTYHPEVTVFEVKEANGKPLGLFLFDPFPREGKQQGAWCSNYVDQWIQKGTSVRPVVVNVGNYTRPVGNAPALLSPDDVRTIFHEFGHGLHSLLSQVRFRGSGNVAIDFVELPSQVMENWAYEPEVLALYAKHYKTGEPLPQEALAKLKKAGTFGQGFATTEYLAATLLDLDWHTLKEPKMQDVVSFEQKSMAKWGLIPEILPRYRTTYFLHSAGGYSAGYYSYIWSAVLDSDAFQAFKEKGNLFDPATAAKFRAEVLSKGGTEDPALLYQRFRGRDPKVGPLLEKRGLK